MAKPEKEALVKEIAEKVKLPEAVFLVDYQGLTVHEINELRKKLRENSVFFKVVKNTLLKLAFKESNRVELSFLEEYLRGPNAILLSDDPVKAAKILSEFAREHDQLEFKAGLAGKDFVDKEKIKQLALLPSKEELISKLLSLLVSPARKLMWALNMPSTQLVRVLSAIKK